MGPISQGITDTLNQWILYIALFPTGRTHEPRDQRVNIMWTPLTFTSRDPFQNFRVFESRGPRSQWEETSSKRCSSSLSRHKSGAISRRLQPPCGSVLAGTKKVLYWQGNWPDYQEEAAMLSHMEGREQPVCHSGDPLGHILYSHALFNYNEQVRQPSPEQAMVIRCSEAVEVIVLLPLLAIDLDLQKYWPLRRSI